MQVVEVQVYDLIPRGYEAFTKISFESADA
jgi:hypothetical protein